MPFDPRLFGAVFAVIFLAELPDKTALAALVLATRYRPLPVFVGAALALTVQSAVAVAAGAAPRSCRRDRFTLARASSFSCRPS